MIRRGRHHIGPGKTGQIKTLHFPADFNECFYIQSINDLRGVEGEKKVISLQLLRVSIVSLKPLLELKRGMCNLCGGK